MKKAFRNKGAIGALLDEYERAISELIQLVESISQDDLLAIADPITKDEDCRSIQTVLTHVVGAGFNYAVAIRKWKGEKLNYFEKQILTSTTDYILQLNKMFGFNEQLFVDYPAITLETYKEDKKILSRWGQRYDVEQLFEHAIVHILRHRRQIERFLLTLHNQ